MSGSEIDVPIIGDPDSQFPVERIAPWAVNNDMADGSTAVLTKAAPGAGYALYVTNLVLSKTTSSSDIAVQLLDEDDTVYLGPLYLVDNAGALFNRTWRCPIKLAANKALYVKGVGGKGSAFVAYVEGFTGAA